MNNTVENDFFCISQGTVATPHGWGGQMCNISCQIFSGFFWDTVYIITQLQSCLLLYLPQSEMIWFDGADAGWHRRDYDSCWQCCRYLHTHVDKWSPPCASVTKQYTCIFTKYSHMNGIIRGSIVFAICKLTPTHKDYFKMYHFTRPMFRSVNVNHY